jgi:lysyl-tRNA synthetase, class I
MTEHYKTWPFEEARKILERIQNKRPSKGYVLLEAGYGPSGLPHIGTFAEVLRTTMVRHAFSELSDIPTKLFSVSDDMDALRKVPTNVPNQDMLKEHLGKPLTKIPDPFGKYESFGHHNNAKLREFLDQFGFDYIFKSSTECYQTGVYDETIKKILRHYDAIMAIMLPTLGEERQQSYSPFLPICPRTGIVLQVKTESINLDANTIVYKDPETQEMVETSVLGGACKLQWKVDWPMRWMAFDVDYEMYGKDLIDSITVGHKICKALKATPPAETFVELFLDEEGKKVSKSKGNGFSMEDWLMYGPEESLAYYIYQNPQRAKKLYFDVIPKATDEYMDWLAKYHEAPSKDNPVWHIHHGNPPALDKGTSDLSFNLLLNLVSVSGTDDADMIWGFIKRCQPATERSDFLDKLIKHAIAYYQNFVKKHYRLPTEQERAGLTELMSELKALPKGLPAKEIQHVVFEVGKRHGFTNLREWFKALYEVLLGQSEGPRMGSFISIYGVDETVKLIESKL